MSAKDRRLLSLSNLYSFLLLVFVKLDWNLQPIYSDAFVNGKQVLALMQVHPKESLGRVIHDNKVVWCLECGILVLSVPFATVICQWLIWIMPNLHVTSYSFRWNLTGLRPGISPSKFPWRMWAAPKKLSNVNWLNSGTSTGLSWIILNFALLFKLTESLGNHFVSSYAVKS